MNKTKLKQTLGMAFLNSPLSAWIEPATRFMAPLAYTFRYAKWYRTNRVKQLVVPTESPFGRHNRYELYNKIAEIHNLSDEEFTYLEFGVAAGRAIEWWLDRNSNSGSRFHGFDTFEGLPEDWGEVPKGTFSTRGAPPDFADDRCKFEVGLFQDTLPKFLESFHRSDGRLIVHIDCDLYSASLFVLIHLGPILRADDILIFDEFADVMHEFRAFLDFVAATGINASVIGTANGGHKMALLIHA